MIAKTQKKYIMELGTNKTYTEEELDGIALEMEMKLNKDFPNCRVHLNPALIQPSALD